MDSLSRRPRPDAYAFRYFLKIRNEVAARLRRDTTCVGAEAAPKVAVRNDLPANPAVYFFASRLVVTSAAES